METVDQLSPYQNTPEMRKKISVVAVSLDESDDEIKAWEKKVRQLSGWTHMRAPEGVRSKVAADYYVLATPVMVLLDAKTMNIVSTPNTVLELKQSDL